MVECNLSSGSSGTSRSLIARVRADDESAWRRLVSLYGPLVFHWCQRSGLQDHDVEDVFQEVFRSVLTHIHSFRKERPGDTFRGWLFTIARNKIRDHFRRARREPRGEGGTEALRRFAQIAAPETQSDSTATEGSTEARYLDPDQAADAPAERALYFRALDLIHSGFQERTWRAFWRTAVDGQPAQEVADELGMSSGAVRVAKSRVLRRLREEMGDVS